MYYYRIKVGDDLNKGQGTASKVVAGLRWILQNKNTYNIRVVNMSLNSSVAESYHSNPINAAVEILWFNKIVVVVSVGNSGSGAKRAGSFLSIAGVFSIMHGAKTQQQIEKTADSAGTFDYLFLSQSVVVFHLPFLR